MFEEMDKQMFIEVVEEAHIELLLKQPTGLSVDIVLVMCDQHATFRWDK